MSRSQVFTKLFVVSLTVLSLSLISAVALAQAAAPAPAASAPASKPAAPAPAAPAPAAKPAAPPAPAPAAPKPAAPAVPSLAAPGGPGAPLSAEAATTAWESEAKTVARQLKLNAEKTAKLVDAYKAARASHRRAMEAKLGEGARPDAQNYAAMGEVATAERTKLETALKGFLTAEETQKAMATLGSFSRRWDQMTAVLNGMKLDEKVQAQAMDTVAAYVAESAAGMMTQPAPADREALRQKSQQAREKLDAEMAKILSPDQLAKWKESTARRRTR